MNCNCNKCNTCPQTNPCASKCIGTITAADIGDLVYVAGLDVNLCKKYSPVDEIGSSFVDCDGEDIESGTAIPTCATLPAQICEALGDLTAGAAVAAGTVLVGTDCLSHAMPAFQAPITVADGSCIDLTLAANVLSAEVIVDPALENILQCREDGLYVNICTGITVIPDGPPVVAGTRLIGDDCLAHDMPAFQSPITANDTNCINLTLAANVLTADPIISPTAGNSLECTANGLYVPDLCTQLADVGGIVLPAEVGDIFITNECIPRTLPVNGGITVLDTTTVDLTLTAGGVLSADVEVSSVPDNILEVRPDGLAVRCTSVLTCIPNTIITAIDTPCLDLTVTEVPDNTFTITGSPVVSPTAGNQLSCTANGLYVAEAEGLTCEAIQDLFVDNVAVISPGQRILVDDCQTYLSPTFTPLDTVTIDTTITEDGLGNPVFSANVVLADTYPTFPAGCNGLVIAGDGLAAPPDSTGNQAEVAANTSLQSGLMEESDVVVSANFTVNITNPSDCRDAILVLGIHLPEINTANLQTGAVLTTLEIFESYNLPAILITPFVSRTLLQIGDTNDDPALLTRQGGDVAESFVSRQFVVPPSFVGSYSVNAVLTQTTGDCDVFCRNPGVSYILYTI